ncbi:hypothetical protein GTA08_BOTSDO08937 [Neofusicoccum parvum]|nr:hypothetical protein GTA08_BOTSDO08937 [Neofusicoccum parvum]
MAYRMLRLNKGGRFPSMFEVLSTAPALTAPSTLLSLARELRDLIYDELIWTYHEATVEAEKLEKQNLKEQDPDEQDPDEQDPDEQDPEEHDPEEQSLPLLHNLTASKKRFSQITGILLVNRQIHHEFRSQLYRLVHGRYIAKIPDNNNAFSWDFRLYSMSNACPHMVHLRYLKLVLETPEKPGTDTTWSDLGQRLKSNIKKMLRALPDLEDLVVTVVLQPYFHTPAVPAQTPAEKSKTLHIDQITGFHLGGVNKRRAALLRPAGGQPPKTKVPKDIDSDFFKPDIYHPNKADTLRELRIKQDALMHSSDGKNHISRFHPCLKTFTKRLAMRFACLSKNPMIFDTQKDTYYEQSGVLEKTERQKMPWHFVYVLLRSYIVKKLLVVC